MRFHWVQRGHEQLATSVDLPAGDDGNGPAHPTVIVVHGLTGQRLGKSYHLVEFARMLSARGLAVVRFDQAGCGESTGRFEELTIPSMIADTRAVCDWAAAQPWCDAQRLAFVGLSLGALPVVACENEYGPFASALWAPVYDMPRVFGNTAKTGLRAILEHQGWVPYRGVRIGKGFVDTLDAVDTGSQLAESAAPLLVCHSRADDVVRFEEGESYRDRCAAIGRACQFVEFVDANHDFADYAHRQKLLETTVAFIAERAGRSGPV